MLHPRNLLLLLLIALPVAGDTIWLDNGDRISGHIELMEGNKLVIRTEFAGQVAVNVKRIRTLESTGPLLIKTRDNTKHARRIQASETDGEMWLINGQPEAVKIASLLQIMEPRPVIQDWVWEGKTDLSVELENADTKKRDFDIDMATEARHGDWRHALAGEFERDYRDGIKSRHLWESEYALSWFFAEQWFWQNSISYRRDHLGDVAKQLQLGFGPGYEWWNNALGRFETSARLMHLRLDARDGEDTRTNGLGLEWDYRRYLFGKRFQLFHNAETIGLTDTQVSYVIDAELGLRYLLNDWAALSLTSEWDYIKSSDEKSRNDTHYKIGIGVHW